MQMPERFISLPGSINFRDFGGYPTSDGRSVKWRQLYRCGSLAMIDENSFDDFDALQISVICDLRRVDEAAMSPTPDAAPFQCRQHIPIEPGSTMMLRASLEDSAQSSRDRVDYMTSITRELARDHGDEYRRLFEELLNAKGGFLLHCSAGKDRTGFGAGLILRALGVDEAVIFEDYLLTNEAQCLRAFMRERMHGFYGNHLDDESFDAITGVRPEYLGAAFDEIRASWGSVERYLADIGVGEREVEALKARLLDG